MTTEYAIVPARVNLPGISPRAFQHALDRQATDNLRKLKGFDFVIQKYMEYTSERINYVLNVASNIRVSQRQLPRLYRMLQDACHILDVPEPELYVAQGVVNAFTYGHTRPYIVVFTGLIDVMNDDEVLAVIAHELGHIKCGHVLYTEMALAISNITQTVGNVVLGLGDLITLPISVGLYSWARRSELSADRAMLLVMQDVRPCISVLMKLAGGTSRMNEDLDPTVFLEQARAYGEELDKASSDRLYRWLASMNKGTHPFAVERAKALNDWVDTREFEDILAGNYERVTAIIGCCSKCGFAIQAGYKFCAQCGEPTDRVLAAGDLTCPKCHTPTQPGFKFCARCGTALRP